MSQSVSLSVCLSVCVHPLIFNFTLSKCTHEILQELHGCETVVVRLTAFSGSPRNTLNDGSSMN